MNKTDSRYLRYQEKITYIVKNSQILKQKPKNELEKQGIFHICQTIIDAMIDTVAMVLKDLGEVVQDDYTNIENLVKLKKITINLGERLKKANGMRNRVAYHYNSFDENIVLDSLKELEKLTEEWTQKVEEIINEFTDN